LTLGYFPKMGKTAKLMTSGFLARDTTNSP
jgi:hypothetical protein